MNREAVLAQKVREIQENLTRWARKQDLLGVGERIVFSLRVEQVPIVARDEHDNANREPERLMISGNCASKFQGKYLRPARVTPELIESIMERMPAGQAQSQLGALFENENQPTRDIHNDVIVRANKRLREPVGGVYYRFATGGSRSGDKFVYQLWEVQPPPV